MHPVICARRSAVAKVKAAAALQVLVTGLGLDPALQNKLQPVAPLGDKEVQFMLTLEGIAETLEALQAKLLPETLKAPTTEQPEELPAPADVDQPEELPAPADVDQPQKAPTKASRATAK